MTACAFVHHRVRVRTYGSCLARVLMFVCVAMVGSAASGGHWEMRAPMPSKRSEVAVAKLDGKIYVIGGLKYLIGWTSGAVEAYDPRTDRWETKTSLPGPLHHAAATAANGKLYVVGGYAPGLLVDIPTLRRPMKEVWEYDPDRDRWRARAPMPTARGALAVGVIDEKIYAVGGEAGGKAVNALEMYDPVTDTWQRLPPMPTPRDHLAVAVLDGHLYAIAGRQRFMSSPVVVNEVYDPGVKRWTTKAPLPTKRSGIAAAVLGRRIYVFGGEYRMELEPFRANEAYDPRTDRWTEHTPMPTGRHGLGAVVIDGRIHVIAGGPKAGRPQGTNVNEVFTPLREKP